MSALVRFLSNTLDCNIDLDESEVYDLLNFYNVYYYDSNSIVGELQESICVGEFLFDFIDIQGLAEYLNYSVISSDCYIDNISLHDFKESFIDDYGENFNKMVSEWRAERCIE